MSNLCIHSLTCHPDIQEGNPVFSGTRVRFETFADFIRIGYSVREILDEFPSISLDQAREAMTLIEAKVSVEQIKSLVGSPVEQRFSDNGFRGMMRG